MSTPSVMLKWLFAADGSGLGNIAEFLRAAFKPAVPLVLISLVDGTITAVPTDPNQQPLPPAATPDQAQRYRLNVGTETRWAQTDIGYAHPFLVEDFPNAVTAHHHVVVGRTSRDELLLINLEAIDTFAIEADDPLPILRSWITQILDRTPGARLETVLDDLDIPTNPRVNLAPPERLPLTPDPNTTVAITDHPRNLMSVPGCTTIITKPLDAGDDAPRSILVCEGRVASLYLAGRFFPIWHRLDLTDERWTQYLAAQAPAPVARAATPEPEPTQQWTPTPMGMPRDRTPEPEATRGDSSSLPPIALHALAPGAALASAPEATAAVDTGQSADTDSLDGATDEQQADLPIALTKDDPEESGPLDTAEPAPTVMPTVEPSEETPDQQPDVAPVSTSSGDEAATDEAGPPAVAPTMPAVTVTIPLAEGPAAHGAAAGAVSATEFASDPGPAEPELPTGGAPAPGPVEPVPAVPAIPRPRVPTGEAIAPDRPGLFVLGDIYLVKLEESASDDDGVPAVALSHMNGWVNNNKARKPVQGLAIVATTPNGVHVDHWAQRLGLTNKNASRKQRNLIKNAAGREVIFQRDGTNLLFPAADLYCDWKEVESLVGSDPAAVTTDALARAASRIRGVPFSGVAEEEYSWREAALLRDHLTDLLSSTLLELGLRQADSDPDLAFRTARRGLEINPDREDLWMLATRTAPPGEVRGLQWDLRSAIGKPESSALRNFLAQASAI